MSIFSYFTGLGNGRTAFQKTSNRGLLDSEMDKELSYDDVRDIYTNFALANRIVNLPINLAISNMETNLEQLNPELIKYIDMDGIISKVKEMARVVRIYGLGVIIPVLKDDDVSNPILKTELYDKEIRYNVIEPLKLSTEVDLNPLSFQYKKIKSISVDGKRIHNNRLLALTNQQTSLYLKYNKSGFSYTGLSVYQNIFKMLQLLNTALISIDRQMIHSSLMLLKQSDAKINNSNLQQQIIEEQARLIEQARQNSTIILKNGYDLQQFQLNNLNSIQEVLSQINNLMALSSDIPSIIFEGNKISGGFSEGSMEMVQLNNYLDGVRNDLITPILKFILTYEIYNKMENIEEADHIVNNLEITYKKEHLDKEVIENAQELEESGIMDREEIKESIED